jgi:hypothetical protein
MVPAISDRISRVPPYSGYCSQNNYVRVRDFHPLRCTFPGSFHLKLFPFLQSYYLPIAETIGIWALPLSIATTQGITIVFSSSGYLDVSVLRVRFPIARNVKPSAWRVAPFGYLRINSYLHLPVAFRSLSRPSSPLRAKASTVCPYLLSSRFKLLITSLSSNMSKNFG